MKKIFFVIFHVILPFMAMAQIKVSGTVTDRDGVPLAGAIIKENSKETNKMIHYTSTDNSGAFSIDVSADNYFVVSMLGYKKQRVDNLTDKEPMKIVMLDEAVALKEVTVKADKVRQNGDTLTYHVATFADKNDRSIGDVLQKIPGFEVNKDNGQISYEGKPISKFYIEGLDMLGNKYGVATKSLPQGDVGSVQVIKNHQPIRVLEDFTYTDDAAVNIRMKEGAKTRWVTSYNGGAGFGEDSGLWKFEGMGLRLKSDFQTMLTYKTNNIGVNVNKETTSLYDYEEHEKEKEFIKLLPPKTPNLEEQRTLFNRSHAVTINTMKRLNESSQMNLQLIYNNNRESAQGVQSAEYLNPNGNRFIENRKDYLQKDNELYGLLKYEKNSERQYLKNSFYGDLTWSRQWLNESGALIYNQFARKPIYDIKDNLFVIHKYGKNLLSFYSNNQIVRMPHELSVNELFQSVKQQKYCTDTYIMGGTKIRHLSISLKAGVNASLRRLETEGVGLPDSLGLLADESRFSFVNVYVSPELTYKIKDVELNASPKTQYVYEKYSYDEVNNQLLFSPNFKIKWRVTPSMTLSLRGGSFVEAQDESRFHRSLVLQDYQNLTQGYSGYQRGHTRSVTGVFFYNNALKSVHTFLTVSRMFTSLPFTTTRQFVGDYIILSGAAQETKADSWQTNFMLSKGLKLWHGRLNLNAVYINSDASMLQDDVRTDYNSQTLNARAGLDFSFWQNMHLRYDLNYYMNDMKMLLYKQTINNWKHDASLTLPFGSFVVDLSGEYYNNELTDGDYKDFFIADAKATYKFRKLDLSLSLTNMFNRKDYSYVVANDLIIHSSTNGIRGREVLLSFYYKL